MKTYPAKKEIKIMGIIILIVGLVNIATYIPSFIEKYASTIYYIDSVVSVFLITYGLMHIFKLDRFE